MPTSSFWDHPIATLEKGLEIRKKIEALKSSLADLMGGVGELPIPFAAKGKKDGRKGKRSAATRAKMAAAQKARWAAKLGKAVPAAAAKAPKKKKRTMSPEARAKIAAAQRARWAKQKKA